MTVTRTRRERGRNITPAEIRAKYVERDAHGDPLWCHTCWPRYGNRKLTFASFADAKNAASELVNHPSQPAVLYVHPCRVDPDRWHHTSRKPYGKSGGVGRPERARWVARRTSTEEAPRD